MKTEMIDRLVAPYVKNQQLTYRDFDKIFGPLFIHKKDEYEVDSYLESKGIELVDELPPETDDTRAAANADVKVERQAVGQAEESDAADDEEIVSDDAFADLDGQDEELTDEPDDEEDEKEPVLYHEDIRQRNETLCIMMQRGNEQARQDLCIKNQRLVYKYARRCSKWTSFLEVDDLMQVGYCGLLKAAERFDPEKGTAFSTYAVWWILQEIMRNIMNEDSLIRIPAHTCEKIYKVMRYDNQLARDGIENLYERIKKIAILCAMSEDDVMQMMIYRDLYMNKASLDCPVGEDASMFLGDMLPDDKHPSVEDTAFADSLKEDLQKVLGTLRPREEQVMRLRFGLDDGRAETLQEVGDKFGITRERIRQIEKRALRRLRHPSRSRQLRGYLD